jgi:oligopeptide transport system substrate-binding protein
VSLHHRPSNGKKRFASAFFAPFQAAILRPMSAQGATRIGVPLATALGTAALVAGAIALASRATIAPADFTFVNGAEPSSLDPAQVTGVPEARIMRAIYEGLCVLDPVTAQPRPGMAEAWDVSGDELTYTFHLRSGSRWSNGDEVTAFDFRDGFRRLLDPREAAQYAYLLWDVTGAKAWSTTIDDSGAPTLSFDTVGIRASDARTLVVKLDRPVPWFLWLCAYHPLSPLDQRALDELRARFPDTWRLEASRPERMVTNGPWKVELRRVNDRIRLVRNDGYWDTRNVAFDTLDVLASEQLTTNLNLYLTGAAGFVNEVPANVIPRLRGRADWNPTPYLATYFYRVNVTHPPLDDVRVRRALALAIDRRSITRLVTKGEEVPHESVVPPGMSAITGYVQQSMWGSTGDFEHDVLVARELLDAAGYGPGGKAMRPIEIHYNTQSTNKDVAEVVAHGWKQALGIDTRLVNQEKKVALDTQRRLDYDVSRSTWIADFPDPASFLEVFTSESENNRTGWSSAKYDALVRQALDARGSERARLYREAERVLLDELPILPVFAFTTTSLVDPELEGFHANPLDVHFPKFWHFAAQSTSSDPAGPPKAGPR